MVTNGNDGKHWGFIVTSIFGLILTTAGLTAFALTPATQPYTQCQQTKPNKAGAQHGHPYQVYNRPYVAGVPSFVQRLTANNDPCHGEDNEKRDLAAQEAAAMWAFWIAAFTAIQLILSGFGLWALLRSLSQTDAALSEAKEANIISRNASIAELRPWLSITANLVSYSSDERAVELDFNITVKNIGGSIAKDISIQYEHQFLGKDAYTYIIAKFEKWNREQYVGRQALMAGESLTRNGWSQSAIEYMPWFGPKNDRVHCVIIVSVFYRSSVDTEIHVTERSFLVAKKSKSWRDQWEIKKRLTFSTQRNLLLWNGIPETPPNPVPSRR